MGMSRSQDDIGYREAIESCRTWNAQTGFGRRERLPFFDDHTQIHHNKCGLYVSEDKRLSKLGPTVIRYPGRNWKRIDPKPMLFEDPIEERDLIEDSYKRELFARALRPTTNAYLATLDDIGHDCTDEGRRKGGKRTRIQRQSMGGGPRKTPKSTHFCGQLNQKKNHSVPPPPPSFQKMVVQKCVLCNQSPQPGQKGLDLLLICSDCKKDHHPACMNFTPSMTIIIQKYNWQCTDCKSCNSCGKSDNDNAILICDNCDRGFHLYCLDPPLKEAPNGTWLCRPCKK